jgi:hypothetical protein
LPAPALSSQALERLADLPPVVAPQGIVGSPTLAPSPAAPAPGPSAAPLRTGPPVAPGPAALAGSPDAGPRTGFDQATPPSASASAPPRLNLELPRLRGGELSRGSVSGVLPLLPRPPELPGKLGREIERAAKPDCRTAYSGAGLLAAIPLAVDAVRKEGGCKW